MIFGYKEYKLTSADRLIRELPTEYISYSRLKQHKGVFSLRVANEDCKAFEKLCKDCGCSFEKLRSSLITRVIHTLVSRRGIAAGLIISTALGLYLSNRVARFDILCSDPEIRKGVMNVLKEEGIETGTFIPAINLVKTERALKQRVEGISWAGITRKGNSLIIDVVEVEAEMKHSRDVFPSNLVACENGVIDKIEIQDGQVKIPVGSGVTKGDIIVSGEIITKTSRWEDAKEIVTTDVSYARSRGKVLGTFERTVTFTQPLCTERRMLSDEPENKSFFAFFDVRLPLFFSLPEGNYEVSKSESEAEIMGIRLPVGITTEELRPYTYEKTSLTADEAMKLAYEKEKLYEKNFLGSYELKSAELCTDQTADGVSVTAHYTLYGEICREVSFFRPASEQIS